MFGEAKKKTQLHDLTKRSWDAVPNIKSISLAHYDLCSLGHNPVVDCIPTEGQPQAAQGRIHTGRRRYPVRSHTHLVTLSSSESCCSWLLSALLNKARWAGGA